jgi:hypothetical protein
MARGFNIPREMDIDTSLGIYRISWPLPPWFPILELKSNNKRCMPSFNLSEHSSRFRDLVRSRHVASPPRRVQASHILRSLPGPALASRVLMFYVSFPASGLSNPATSAKCQLTREWQFEE